MCLGMIVLTMILLPLLMFAPKQHGATFNLAANGGAITSDGRNGAAVDDELGAVDRGGAIRR